MELNGTNAELLYFLLCKDATQGTLRILVPEYYGIWSLESLVEETCHLFRYQPYSVNWEMQVILLLKTSEELAGWKNFITFAGADRHAEAPVWGRAARDVSVMAASIRRQ